MVEEKYQKAENTYAQIKEEVRQRALALDEAVSQSAQVCLCLKFIYPCTESTVTLSIDSQRDGTYDSPLAPSEKATDLYANSTGSLTLLLQLKRNVDLHVSTGDEA